MTDVPIDHSARRQIAESILGPIDDRGYCHCPGEALHTNHKASVRRERIGRDCRVYLTVSDRNPKAIPTVKCVHTSCGGAIADANHRLRSEIAKHEAKKAKEEGYTLPSPQPRRRSQDEAQREREEKIATALALRSAASLPAILRDYSWDRYAMWEQSAPIPDTAIEQARALLSLFEPSDIVWCGVHADSISPEDAADPRFGKRLKRVSAARPFRTTSEWLQKPSLPGPRICPSSFKPGTLSRSNDAVLHRRFLVIEHDKLPMEGQCAVLRWLHEAAHLRLRAIVFTGGKSLHGWFDCPEAERLKELEIILVGVRKPKPDPQEPFLGGMGFDPATFVPSQAYRVPGWRHDKTNRPVELWYWGGGP